MAIVQLHTYHKSQKVRKTHKKKSIKVHKIRSIKVQYIPKKIGKWTWTFLWTRYPSYFGSEGFLGALNPDDIALMGPQWAAVLDIRPNVCLEM